MMITTGAPTQYVDLDLRGHLAHVRAGWHVAMRITDWKLSSFGPSVYRCEGTIQHIERGWLSYSPLDLVLTLPGNAPAYTWRFDNDAAIVINGDSVVIDVAGLPALKRAS